MKNKSTKINIISIDFHRVFSLSYIDTLILVFNGLDLTKLCFVKLGVENEEKME